MEKDTDIAMHLADTAMPPASIPTMTTAMSIAIMVTIILTRIRTSDRITPTTVRRPSQMK
ncbi:MAG: hypothetical protein HBSAPP02_31150 [Phycisphaerae bacterium]|nr:MAG: hypothetical protein HBSAPP02_31150 [Phycisphaerae bacterium]